MGFVVNNTTKCGLIDLLCPHTCRGCGLLGDVLCERCKKYIISQRQSICPLCKKEFAKTGKNVASVKCPDCNIQFANLWALGWREKTLKKLIADYKYQSVRAISRVLVELLDVIIPEDYGKKEEIIVVPLPTIGRHVRERGFDHTLLLAKKLAKRRGWQCRQILSRAQDTVQVGTKASEREKQAKRAYEVTGIIKPDAEYLLLDDVWTTGASMLAAAQVMRDAGAKNLSAVVCSVSKPKTE